MAKFISKNPIPGIDISTGGFYFVFELTGSNFEQISPQSEQKQHLKSLERLEDVEDQVDTNKYIMRSIEYYWNKWSSATHILQQVEEYQSQDEIHFPSDTFLNQMVCYKKAIDSTSIDEASDTTEGTHSRAIQNIPPIIIVPNSEKFFQLAISYSKQRRYLKSMQSIYQAIQIEPHNIRFLRRKNEIKGRIIQHNLNQDPSTMNMIEDTIEEYDLANAVENDISRFLDSKIMFEIKKARKTLFLSVVSGAIVIAAGTTMSVINKKR